MPAKTKNKKSSSKITSFGSLKSKPIFNKRIAVLLALVIAGLGTYFVFFTSAATNNCQAQDKVQICDVNEVAATTDTILSIDGEAENHGKNKWGVYYGTAFRAPKTAYNGSVAINRVYNKDATLHDWVTASQKKAKEAKYGTLVNQGVAFFAWEKQVKDTVPIYRISRAGEATQVMFSADKAWVDKMLATGKNDPNGWKKDVYGSFIAFYAYPVNYKVANQVNPYDCSIQANFVTDRCTEQRENLQESISSGATPATNACPKDLKTYLAAPLPGQFPSDCQKYWNTYMQDCSVEENFVSSRCTTNRETLEKALDCSLKVNQGTPRCPSGDTTSRAPGSNISIPRPVPFVGSPSNPNPVIVVTPAPSQPPAAKPSPNLLPCPSAPNMEAGLAKYIREVNANGANRYPTSCHQWYITYAQNKGKAKQIPPSVNIDNIAREQRKNQELQNFLRHAKAMQDICAASNQIPTSNYKGCKALPETNQYLWQCNLVGQAKVYGFNGHSWKNVFRNPHVRAITEARANNVECVKWRNGLNAQKSEYRNFVVNSVTKL